jgi:peptide/nickel transport system substrate-binding protein
LQPTFVNQAPGNNKQVRQAINYAIDRKRIVEQVLLGIGRPNALPWNPASPAFDAAKNQSCAFDLDKARSLLSASGGSNITFDFNYNGSSPEWGTIGQILQSDLAKIGVILNLKPADAPTLQQLSNSRSFNGLYAGSQQYGRIPAPAPYYDPSTTGRASSPSSSPSCTTRSP